LNIVFHQDVTLSEYFTHFNVIAGPVDDYFRFALVYIITS